MRARARGTSRGRVVLESGHELGELALRRRHCEEGPAVPSRRLVAVTTETSAGERHRKRGMENARRRGK